MTTESYRRRILARLSEQGTAVAETAVCHLHTEASPAIPDAPGPLVDCTGNDELECLICGATNHGYDPTLDERVALTGENVTLDGRPARISGYRRQFATVTDRADPIRSAEWAWPTVARIVANGGDFRS